MATFSSALSIIILATCHLIVWGSSAPLHRAVEKVPDSYIIRIKDGYDVDDVARFLENHIVMRQSGAKITHRYRRSIRGVGAHLPTKETLDLVQNLEAVEYVAENGVVHVVSSNGPKAVSSFQSGMTSLKIPWNLDRIDQAKLPLDGKYNPPNSGKGVTVYVLDSGILTTHTEFQKRASSVFDAFDGDGIDCAGHGTHVAAVIAGATYGVAKQATVHSVRVIGAECDINGTVADVVAGIDWVSQHVKKPAVVALSMNMFGEHIPLSHALDGLINETGVTVVVAAGNMDVDACDSSPASNKKVITVGATNKEDGLWPLSNWGPCVDVFAPGDDILSATCSGPSDTKTLSGTSTACPHVAGVAAIVLADDPSLDHSRVKLKIVKAATSGVLKFDQQEDTTANMDDTANLLLRAQIVDIPDDFNTTTPRNVNSILIHNMI